MKVLLFCDGFGIQHFMDSVAWKNAIGLVAASNRKQYHNDLEKIARESGLSFFIQPPYQSPLYPEFVQTIEKLSPDLIIVNSYSMILRPDVFCIPKYGAINIHPSLLPLNRGCNPTQWAIIKGEINTGVTLHFIDEGIDTGDIIAQRVIPILTDDTWVNVQERFSKEIHSLLRDELSGILSGTIEGCPQKNDKSTSNRRRVPEDGLFDLKAPVIDIYNLIRALVAPLPGAFYFKNGSKIIIDQYMALSQVTVMKYGDSDIFKLESATVILSPFSNDTRNQVVSLAHSFGDLFVHSHIRPKDFESSEVLCLKNDAVVFRLQNRKSSENVGLGGITNIDFMLCKAEIWVKLNKDQLDNEKNTISQVIDLMLKFSFYDLELTWVYVFLDKDLKDHVPFDDLIGSKERSVLENHGLTDSTSENLIVMKISKENYEGK